MTSLFVWVAPRPGHPQPEPVCRVASSRPRRRRIKVDRETARITDTERDDLGRRLVERKAAGAGQKIPRAGGKHLRRPRPRSGWRKTRPSGKPGRPGRREVQAAWDEANRIQSEKAEEIWREFGRREAAQTGLSRYLSMVSPLADFTYLATDLSSTGMRNQAHFARSAPCSGGRSPTMSSRRPKASRKRTRPPIGGIRRST